MKIIELLLTNKSLLEIMNKNGVRVRDVELIPVMTDIELMMSRGDKKTYIVSALAKKYKISERTIYFVINRFTKNVKFD